MEKFRLNGTINSCLWAAYGDALGFISELVDAKGLKRRINVERVTENVRWRRKIGGRFGTQVMLPAGCYSDDTQLRLATSRAIRGDGRFDVEVFAKVELPVWLSYALGAGRGSKLAARSLAHQDITWFSNFFDERNSRYVQCGGNGAAMRIQPHVWAAKDLSKRETFIVDVVRNSVCTHGHSRGILGAVFHSLCLALALDKHEMPGPNEWQEVVEFFRKIPTLIREDTDLSSFWLPVWERRSNQSIEKAFERVQKECLEDIKVVEQHMNAEPKEAYNRLLQEIGGLKASSRGSGTKTSIIAAALSWLYRQHESPSEAMITAANLLGSDTDTIATMAGALLGIFADKGPQGELLDREYLEREVSRLYEISSGKFAPSFQYPDLFEWQPPKTQQDVVGTVKNGLAVAGLGIVDLMEEPNKGPGKGDAVWQWVKLDFGQSIIVKRRSNPRRLSQSELPKETNHLTIPAHSSEPNVMDVYSDQPSLFASESLPKQVTQFVKRTTNLDQLTNEAINSGFNEALIGRHILKLSEQSDGIEKAGIYAGIIAKAKIARSRSKKNSK